MGELGFFCWFQILSSSQFIPVVLPQDAEFVSLVSYDSLWYISHEELPNDHRTPFPVPKGTMWSYSLPKRRTVRGSIVAYVKSDVDVAILHCFATDPSAVVR